MIVSLCIYCKYPACLVFVMESLSFITPNLRYVFVYSLLLVFGLLIWVLTPAWTVL